MFFTRVIILYAAVTPTTIAKARIKKTKERKREKKKTERLRNLLFCVKVVT